MSRIGRKPLFLPSTVTFEKTATTLKFTGPKGTLESVLPEGIKLEEQDGVLKFTRESDIPAVRALHGLAQRLAQNAILGVTEGFSKDLMLVGTGYRVAPHADGLTLSVGYSHPVIFKKVPGVTITIEGQDKIKVTGIDKQLVGQVSADIRAVRKPEPYKGKGIRYSDEVVLKKQGKTATKTAA
ncbi:50S ribosomal protein L6 [Candidatus Collierbacteria bacterium CG10_big_fil_rev_8_21_14_0_10_43_36]|uniref:50S ribosomal protein L6 n=3 Tax=Candidatus Collieribacteriota TaxID=1752725 RepID=A0A2H0DUV0_9BACT|nr:50S ribosomal protein L6 [bacterium]PIP85628.1 MAG: 50S ribosomal protein L6 [Candidatus Collierbacteria bacterium CG22_combo_CG10-13_8_21_14_all_43_12]PIR99535.1 MAG: 50S ribosomal protein L6 [Candidatus Collierbacteria bacterium CG10_big_fil_rev_8_21_14_0_10_43_36]PIZ24314.1 MAG: 50S ribosomal protein L6 [Candidatus Collierbacteria bacterium CG_4_10_14_0_8_um_filter_43_86]PJB47654.1 MAG: 50S ribosomal protein L6 [Candidatus Collierbacteria bacterium CG_4_9_14_3_um_filter_43_16]